jgi:polyferredoxin
MAAGNIPPHRRRRRDTVPKQSIWWKDTPKGRQIKPIQAIRGVVQAWFVYLILATSFGQIITEQLSAATGSSELVSPTLHSYSPLGGFVSLYRFFTTGRYLSHIHTSNLVMLVIVFVITILLGAFFCGWMCPFGAVLEWWKRLTDRLFGINVRVPVQWDTRLKYLRYFWFLLLVVITAFTGKLVFSDWDPYMVLFSFGREAVFTAVAVLGVALVGSAFIERFWCRYMCPVGGMVGIFHLLSLTKVKMERAKCIDCGLCNRVCTMGIDVQHTKSIVPAECVNCLECVEQCPTNALALVAGRR